MAVAAAAFLGLAANAVHAEIRIAIAGPMKGQYSVFGLQMKRGAEKAVADINANGGVLGQKIKLLIGDDGCDPRQAVAVAKKMAAKGVVFMAGHLCSVSSIPASSVYAKKGILQISPGSSNPLLTERGLTNVFRICGRDDRQGSMAGEYLADHYADSRIAIVHDKQAYSKDLTDAVRARLKKRGVKEVYNAAVDVGAKDYAAFVKGLKRRKIDVLYFGGYYTEAGLIVREMREQGLATRLISGDALATYEYWEIAGKHGEGTLLTFRPDPRKNPDAQDVIGSFRRAEFDPEGYTLYTYAAIQIWAQAAEKAGSLALGKMTKALRGKVFMSVLGKISFDAKGDIKQPAFVWYEWSKGNYAER